LIYLHPDHLNTPRVGTTVAQGMVWNWMSDAYGTTAPNEDVAGTGTLTHIPLRFPGQLYDAQTQLNYNYYRDYDANLGRYVQSDPIGLGGGMNTYAYVGGNPLSFTDPFGLLSFSDVTGAISDATGGCSSNSFTDDVVSNFVDVEDQTSPLKTGMSLTLGGAFAKQYGGLTALGAATNILRDYRAGYAITMVGSRTFMQAAATGAATWAVNGVLIKGSYDAGVLTGSILRTGINRAASASACACKK